MDLTLDDWLEQHRGGRRVGIEGYSTVLRLDAPITRDSLSEVEEATGYRFPEAYVRCVTEIGLPYLEVSRDRGEHSFGPLPESRMLLPSEQLEILSAFKTWVVNCTSDFDDDPVAAAEEQARWDAFIPFQFLGDGSATDVYCFVRGDERDGLPRVVAAYHDDDACDEEEEDERIYGFFAHLQDVLDHT
ncbi:MAG: hypothetical protein AB8I08_03010 [Sandaracinaceae bacterium]